MFVARTIIVVIVFDCVPFFLCALRLLSRTHPEGRGLSLVLLLNLLSALNPVLPEVGAQYLLSNKPLNGQRLLGMQMRLETGAPATDPA